MNDKEIIARWMFDPNPYITNARVPDTTKKTSGRPDRKPERTKKTMLMEPKMILKSGNRMIVFWADGTKTIVKRAEDEPDNDYNAFTAALAIKMYGSNSKVKKILKCVETQKEKKHGKTGKTEKETATGRG